MPNDNLQKIKYVVDQSKSVQIDTDRINNLPKQFLIENCNTKGFIEHFDFRNIEEKLNFIFLSNCINFGFWGNTHWKIKKDGKIFKGSLALFESLYRALKQDERLSFGKHLSQIKLSEFSRIFEENDKPPRMNERWVITRSVGQRLFSIFQDSFLNVVKKANFNTRQLLEIMTSEFPELDDRSIYEGQEIGFYKKAQLIISMVSQEELPQEIEETETLTAFPDYRLPQILHHLKILKYSKDLQEITYSKRLIQNGSKYEIEIRANSIWAIEILKESIQKNLKKTCKSWEIDNVLWKLAHDTDNMKPHHRTPTTFY